MLKQCMRNPLIISNNSLQVSNFSSWIMNPNFFSFAPNAVFALFSHSIKLGFCNQSIDNEKHYHVLVEFTIKSSDLINKMTSKAFVLPCVLFTFEQKILGCSEYQLSGPLIEKLKIAVKFNLFNNLVCWYWCSISQTIALSLLRLAH